MCAEMTSTSRTVRVVKVGGSLFDYEDLAAALARFLDLQPPAATVLIAGGGAWANAVREVEAHSRIGERVAHDLCIRAMGVTARVLAALTPQYTLETCWERLRTWTHSPNGQLGAQVFDVAKFLEDVEPRSPGLVLPHDWSATSDSIAARVAHLLEAAELILLKSAPLANEKSMHDAAAEGYVDGFFPHAARELTRVRCVNLRDREFRETMWECETHLAD